MTEKKPWHTPKFQLLDTAATAADQTVVTDDFTTDDFAVVGDTRVDPSGADATDPHS
jgi:hypothetical protein